MVFRRAARNVYGRNEVGGMGGVRLYQLSGAAGTARGGAAFRSGVTPRNIRLAEPEINRSPRVFCTSWFNLLEVHPRLIGRHPDLLRPFSVRRGCASGTDAAGSGGRAASAAAVRDA